MELLRRLALVHRLSRPVRQAPVGLLAKTAGVDDSQMTGQEAVDSPQQGGLAGEIELAQVRPQKTGGQAAIKGGGLEEALGLRGEENAVADAGPVERLLAQPVPGQQQPAAGRIPEGQGEHAPQPR